MRANDGTRWNESFPRTPSYRQVTPPQPVTINLDQALARDNPPLRTFTVHSGNHRAALDFRQWLPSSAITPRQRQPPPTRGRPP